MINVFPRRYILWMMLSCSSSWKISLTHPPTLEFLYWNLSGGQPVSQWNTPTFWIDPTNLEVEWNLARISRARIERGISKQNVKTLLLDRHSFAYIYIHHILEPLENPPSQKNTYNCLMICCCVISHDIFHGPPPLEWGLQCPWRLKRRKETGMLPACSNYNQVASSQ